ncbi:unnamed protein product [Anisakis simplex]|uniref:Uncharacterized protein n=1 Tax=Anisakis simplex TaxID=6269 RepID=A0A3P6PJC1_ANISI|nr:unnamed protein product [Anisakis simplex]
MRRRRTCSETGGEGSRSVISCDYTFTKTKLRSPDRARSAQQTASIWSADEVKSEATAAKPMSPGNFASMFISHSRHFRLEIITANLEENFIIWVQHEFLIVFTLPISFRIISATLNRRHSKTLRLSRVVLAIGIRRW